MTTDAKYPQVSWQAVVREQFGAVGLLLRREWMLLLGLQLIVTVMLLYAALSQGPAAGEPSLDFNPTFLFLVSLLGFVVPLSIWRGEEPSNRSYHWAMPIRRSHHAIIKTFVGWAWYMVAVALILIWTMLVVWLTGGDPGIGGPYGYPLWRWVLPFVASTIAYLLGSVFVLRSDNPGVAMLGVVIGFWALLMLAVALNMQGLFDLVVSAINGPFGLKTAMTGTAVILQEVIAGPGSVVTEPVAVQRTDLWLGAAAVWLGIGALGVGLAASKHQER